MKHHLWNPIIFKLNSPAFSEWRVLSDMSHGFRMDSKFLSFQHGVKKDDLAVQGQGDITTCYRLV